MKNFFYSLFLNTLIIVVTSSIFNGFKLPSEVGYWLASILILAMAIQLHKPLLKFLTVNNNFVTYFVAVTLLLVGALYALVTFVPGFYLEASRISGLDAGVVSINPQNLSSLGTTLGTALVISLISGIMETLKKGSSD